MSNILNELGIDHDDLDWFHLGICRGMDTNLFYDKFDISIKNDIAFNVKALTQYPYIVHQISNEIIQNDLIQQLIIKYISLDGNLIRLLNSENRKNQIN